jgi:hypothetical protein
MLVANRSKPLYAVLHGSKGMLSSKAVERIERVDCFLTGGY